MKSKRWFRQSYRDNNAVAACINFLQILEVPVTKTYIRNFLQNHRFYQTLQSISDLLSVLNIQNFAARVSIGDLSDADYPVLGHIQKNGGSQFVVVCGVSSSDVSFLDPEEGWTRMSVDDFERRSSGVMLLTQASKHSGQTDFATHRLQERLDLAKAPALIGIAATLLATLLIFSLPAAQSAWFYLVVVKVTGLCASTLLLVKTVNTNGSFIDKLCNFGMKKPVLNCSGVLDSKASKFLGIGWSEVGFVYFAGGFLSLSLSAFSGSGFFVLWFLGVLNLVALPYTVFSLYYQAMVVKQFCTLCTIVQILLWIEFLLLFQFTFSQIPPLGWNIVAAISWGFLIPLGLLILAKRPFARSLDIVKFERRLSLFEKNPDVMKALIESKRYHVITEVPDDIVLGSEQAPDTVLVILSPFCGPCASAFSFIAEFGNVHPGSARFIIRFLVQKWNNDTYNDAISQIVLETIDATEQKILALLDAWYTEGVNGLARLQNKNSPNKPEDTERVASLMRNYLQTCEELDIQKTPSIFINGREIPDGFSFNDLNKFLRNTPAQTP